MHATEFKAAVANVSRLYISTHTGGKMCLILIQPNHTVAFRAFQTLHFSSNVSVVKPSPTRLLHAHEDVGAVLIEPWLKPKVNETPLASN